MLTFLMIFFLVGDEPGVYGAGVKDETPAVSIKKLMKDPEAYMGQVVKVTGTVKEVCPMAGCWMDMTEGDAQVRIKVKDGEIVFDDKLEGKKVLAEGTVYKFDLTKEEAVGYFRHMAEEKGEEFDPASITEGTTIYQLGGIGAKVLK